MLKNPPATAGNTRGVVGSPGLKRSPEEENGFPTQYILDWEISCGRKAWQVTVYGATKIQTHN